MTTIRLAAIADIDSLVQMRWAFTAEEQALDNEHYGEFYEVCSQFLREAITGGDWYVWVAEVDTNIVAHMYLQLIHKVPRPGKSPEPRFGYVTNVYTRPAYRSQGIGTRIHQAMEAWSQAHEVEFLILWPSSSSQTFYERNGFARCDEAMEKHW